MASVGELFLSENENKSEQPEMTEVKECDLIAHENGDENGDERARISLDSGDSRSGCMVFEVRQDIDPALFEYELQPQSAALWELGTEDS